MLKIPSTFIAFFYCTLLYAQQANYYEDRRGNTHLAGPFDLEVLVTNPLYAEWYQRSAEGYEPDVKQPRWAKQLKDVQVTIYMGTWCGDSKNYVPKFVKTWEALGLDPDQLHFVGLYGSGESGKYKQGPNQEEQGKHIHRVPTFIFERAEEEVARIVEYPVNDLVTDIAQIALGYPSQPNYRAANYLMAISDQEEAMELSEVYAEVRRMVQGRKELNTLGYVWLEAGRVDDALLAFEINKWLHPYDHNVYDSYAEALAKKGENELAIENYERVLLLDRSNDHAREQIARLRE